MGDFRGRLLRDAAAVGNSGGQRVLGIFSLVREATGGNGRQRKFEIFLYWVLCVYFWGFFSILFPFCFVWETTGDNGRQQETTGDMYPKQIV